MRRPRTLGRVILTLGCVTLSVVTAVLVFRETGRQQRESNETALKERLSEIRHAIERYRHDSGSHPRELPALVDTGYLLAVPRDPVTGRRHTWLEVFNGCCCDDTKAIIEGCDYGLVDVRSGAPGSASDGSMYADW
jgi:general secretion pathway protein G